jgi:hypothetical protein
VTCKIKFSAGLNIVISDQNYQLSRKPSPFNNIPLFLLTHRFFSNRTLTPNINDAHADKQTAKSGEP